METLSSERVGIVSLTLLTLFSFFGWYVLFHGSILSSFGSVTLSLLLGFSLAATFYFLGAVLWREQYEFILGAIIPFLPALFFMPAWIMFFAVLIGSALTYLSLILIHKEKKERVRFQYFLVCNRGASQFIVALALVISAAYFLQARGASWEDLVPRLQIDQGTTTILMRVVAWWHPELLETNTNKLTVDQYLLNLAKEDENLATDNVIKNNELFTIQLTFAPDIERLMEKEGITFEEVRTNPYVQEQYLKMGHKYFSTLVGGTVTGNEPLDTIVLQVMQDQISLLLEGTDNITLLLRSGIPIALGLALFLALWPVGALLSYGWLFVGYLLYRTLLRYGHITLTEHLEEVEVLEVVEQN
jgi:hypothetical protein